MMCQHVGQAEEAFELLGDSHVHAGMDGEALDGPDPSELKRRPRELTTW